MGLRDREWWGLKGELKFLFMVEQLNPTKALSVLLAKVEAVRKVIYRIPA